MTDWQLPEQRFFACIHLPKKKKIACTLVYDCTTSLRVCGPYRQDGKSVPWHALLSRSIGWKCRCSARCLTHLVACAISEELGGRLKINKLEGNSTGSVSWSYKERWRTHGTSQLAACNSSFPWTYCSDPRLQRLHSCYCKWRHSDLMLISAGVEVFMVLGSCQAPALFALVASELSHRRRATKLSHCFRICWDSWFRLGLRRGGRFSYRIILFIRYSTRSCVIIVYRANTAQIYGLWLVGY